MHYGFKAHAVKHEPIALQLLEQTLELGLQLRVTRLGGCEQWDALFLKLSMIVCYLFLVGWLVAGWIVAERLDGSRCRLAKILEDRKFFSLEISGHKVVLLCKFSLYGTGRSGPLSAGEAVASGPGPLWFTVMCSEIVEKECVKDLSGTGPWGFSLTSLMNDPARLWPQRGISSKYITLK